MEKKIHCPFLEWGIRARTDCPRTQKTLGTAAEIELTLPHLRCLLLRICLQWGLFTGPHQVTLL